MLVKIYWIDETDAGRLGIMPRPRGGNWIEDEIKSLKFSGVDVVVSLLENEEIEELDITKEGNFCESNDILYLSFPIKDRDVPLLVNETLDFTQELFELFKAGKSIVIHCRQGIGRSSLIAACILVLNEFSSEEAFEKIKLARGCEIPDTNEQRDWVKKFAEAI